jgi:ketosteroid isomerase-like protein
MNNQQTSSDALRELETTWAQAARRADTGTLEAISTGDFALVGPLGFVLNKEQWLERYRSGDLVTHSLSFEDPVTRVYGDAALTIARHVQQASYQGQPADGEFRTTHIAVHREGGWLLAGIQLSPIGGPPPFAPPAGQRAGEGPATTPGHRR